MSNDSKTLLNTLSLNEKIRLLNGDGSWKTYNAAGKLPYFFMSDGPHGLRKQDEEKYADLNKSKVATCFPTASCVASSWNKDSLTKLGQAIGNEALNENVNMVLGPGINIKRSPLCGRNFEYFSEDPYLAGQLAANYVSGMQSLGVATCVKHYACNNQEKRRQTSSSIIDERTLREIYLRAFEIVVKKSSPVGIMGSYNKVNGEYVCASHKLLTQILRNEWGFKGIVISDWGACIDATKCLQAGLNLAMPDSLGYFSKSLKKALSEKVIDESLIEKADERILDVAQWFTNFSNTKSPATDSNIQTENTYALDYNKQHQIARELACDSAVLLKNNGILPLQPGKIAVIGELAQFMKFQGGGSSHITTKDYPNALEAFMALGYDVSYSKGYFSGFCKEKNVVKKNEPLCHAALEFARTATQNNTPILFFTGLTERYEGEGFDRETLDLPKEQSELLEEVLKITDNVIVINFCGAPIDFSPAQKAKAILQMYLPGEAAGEAVADLVSGKVNPSGKLAETWPLCMEDIPCQETFAKETDNVPYKENVFVGYRFYETKNMPVQYEFGYGLSYTKFEYSELQVDLGTEASRSETNVTKTTAQVSDKTSVTYTAPAPATVSLKVTNAGTLDGSEIVQIYVAPVQTQEEQCLRPAKELRGFTKVFLKAGESKTVEIQLDENAFKVFSEKNNNFVTIGGCYKVQAGASIKDIRLEQEVQVQGEVLLENVSKVSESFYTDHFSEPHCKGSFTTSDSLGEMSKSSHFIRGFIKIMEFVLVLMNKGRSKEDPAVKIAISAIKENPLESLISTSGGAISEKTAAWLVKMANK